MMAWPLVDVHDDGIRPAGKPDQCFYCKRRVGSEHARDCNIVQKKIEMRVTATLADGKVRVGTWKLLVPHFWDPGMSEFHKNESSWCATNFLRRDRNDIAWEGKPEPWEALEAMYAAGDCLCNGALRFEFVRTIDDTPFRALHVPEKERN